MLHRLPRHALRLALAALLALLPMTRALAHDVSAVARERMQNGGILDYIWTGAEHILHAFPGDSRHIMG